MGILATSHAGDALDEVEHRESFRLVIGLGATERGLEGLNKWKGRLPYLLPLQEP